MSILYVYSISPEKSFDIYIYMYYIYNSYVYFVYIYSMSMLYVYCMSP